MFDDDMKLNMVKGIIKKIVDESLEEGVKRPRVQSVVDWRQIFWVMNQDTGKSERVIKHHLPVDPKVGEIWQIPTANYGGESTTEAVTVQIDKVIYKWQPVYFDNESLEGWYLEIDIECHQVAQ